MEAILRHLCEIHGLTTISVMFRYGVDRGVTIYPHWNQDGENMCASCSGDTFDEAFASAISEVSERRNRRADEEREAFERQQYEEERRQLENEEMARHFEKHPHG